ncbi:hypothetical protein [Ekhidna sp.]|uniref:hypothetical protein n=1 Tax=Ekhidna sp. TaxID=2608089 RepID=UPI003BAC5E74
MILIRLVQGYFIEAPSYYELKWLLLGEWLNNGFKMYSETFDYTGPIAAFVYKYLDLILGRTSFAQYGISSIVIIFQAAIFNQILLKNKAYDENSYLPGFLYMILMVSIPDFMTLSPQLMSLTFILLALRNVLRRIDNQVTDELFLNSGILIGVATMIYLPSVVFFLVFLFALILFSSAVTRRLLLYLFSFLLVFALCGLYFFWRGDFWLFFDSYIIQNLVLSNGSPLDIVDALTICAGFIFVFLLAVFKTWSSARLTNFQQKIQQVIWLMFLGAVATFFLSNEKSLHELVFLIPVITYFWVHYFVLIRRKFFKMVMPGILILGLIGFSIFTYSALVSKLIAKEPMLVKPKTMLIGEDAAYYMQHEMLTPCFNTHLCEKAFQGLDFYTSATRLYQIFEKTDAEIIIDEMGIMPAVFNRFPNLERKYNARKGDEYAKISN